MFLGRFLVFVALLGRCAAFSLSVLPCRSVAGWRGALTAPRMEMQELEFIIYPDGRIEERVLGVKGADCQKLTEKINQELGEVYSTEATAEMFEQPVQVNVEEEVENTQSAWSDSGSSYGGSTW